MWRFTWVNKPLFVSVLTSILAITGFIAGFFFPLRIAIPLRYDLILPFAGIFLILWAAWKLPHPWNQAVSAGLTTALFSAALATLWRTGTHEVYDVFGLLPWFDSQGYYSEATRLLDGGVFTQISARRPLFPGYFSTWLLFTGRNLRLSIALMTFFAGISTWILSREIWKSEKLASIPAAITTLLFFYYRVFIGAVLTEVIGFTLGSISLALLWNAAVNHKLLPALTGLFCLTLALSARPGAVFSLPCVILWMTFLLFDGTSRIKRFVSANVVVAAGLIINFLMTAALAQGIAASYSNFAQTFYGLVNGGVGWRQVYTDHPEFFTTGDESQASKQIYLASLEIIQSHPEKSITGIGKSIGAFFSTRHFSAFCFLKDENTPRDPNLSNAPMEFISRLMANILLVLLLPVAYFARTRPKYTLLLAINLGILVSIPFAPPWDAENMRAYAATMPAMIFAISMTLLFFFQKGKPPTQITTSPPNTAYAMAALLVISMTIIPVLVKNISHAPQLPGGACPAGEIEMITRVNLGSSISIGSNPLDTFAIPYSRFISNLDQFPDAVIGQQLKKIPENYFLAQQNDLTNNGSDFWLAAPLELLPEAGHSVIFCGKWSSDPAIKFVFFANSLLP